MPARREDRYYKRSEKNVIGSIEVIPAGPASNIFDSITEEMKGPAEEVVTLTWHGADVKIFYNGSGDDFLKNVYQYSCHFDEEEYAAKLMEEEGFARTDAADIASHMQGALDDMAGLRNPYDAPGLNVCDEYGNDIFSYRPDLAYISVKRGKDGLAAVELEHSYGPPPEVAKALGYVYIEGKLPGDSDFEELFGYLNGKPVDEALRLLRVYAGILPRKYGKTSVYSYKRKAAGTNPGRKKRQGSNPEPEQQKDDQETAGSWDGVCNWGTGDPSE